MYSFEVDSIVESVLSPCEACGDLTYIHNGKHYENEVHLVTLHIDEEVLCCSESMIFIWKWDIKVTYVGMPVSYKLRTTFIEQNSTQDCCFRFFIYKNLSALAYQDCQQSLYNKHNKQVELTYLDQLTIIKWLYNNS